MQLNLKKTKVMRVSRNSKCNLKITDPNGVQLEQVEKFKYLGTHVNFNAKDDYELRVRIAQGKNAFNDLKSFLCNKSLPFSTRNKVLTCYVLPVVTYNSET